MAARYIRHTVVMFSSSACGPERFAVDMERWRLLVAKLLLDQQAQPVEMADNVRLIVTWGRNEYTLTLSESDKVVDIKEQLYTITNVLPAKQKLLGLKMAGGKQASDDSSVVELQLKANQKVMLIGTPEKDIPVSPPEGEGDDVVNDLDWNNKTEALSVKDRDENIRKLSQRIQKYEVKILNSPRSGKKCLVLDIDYTLFDHRSTVETPVELMRPYLHEFLTAAYEHFDIVIWSATSMQWIQLKMTELGVLSNPNYKIAFFLDYNAMITVETERHGVHNTKPLGVIWAKFPEHYHPKNTLHIDDLGRNFVMNPSNGLKIKPFKHAPRTRATDRQLLKLIPYIRYLGTVVEDFTAIDHSAWKRHVNEHHRPQQRE